MKRARKQNGSNPEPKTVFQNVVCVNPRLAKEIGFHAAALLEQLLYWMWRAPKENWFPTDKNDKQPQPFVYKSVDEWTDEMPWKDRKATMRAINRLLVNDSDYGSWIVKGNFSSGRYAKTGWYSINLFRMNAARFEAALPPIFLTESKELSVSFSVEDTGKPFTEWVSLFLSEWTTAFGKGKGWHVFNGWMRDRLGWKP